MGLLASSFQCDFGGRLGHGADVLAAGGGAAGLAAVGGIGDRLAIEADGAAGVVIARNREGDALRVRVRIEDGDDRDAEHVGFLDRQLFLVGIDDEHDVRQAAHVADAAQRLLELVALAGQLEDFLLGEAGGVARQLLLKALEALDRVGDGLPVGQHAAEPAVVDEMLARNLRRFRDRVLRLALGADEQHLAAAGGGLLDEVERAGEQAARVCDRSMMWTPLRSPKMYGFIRGFQRWVWWPKCAPASSNCCMVTTVAAMVFLLPVLPRRSHVTDRNDPAPVWWLRLWDGGATSRSRPRDASPVDRA